jgi:hypothetical protein
MLVTPVKQGDWHSVETAIRQITQQLGPQAAVVFREIIMAGLAAGRPVTADGAGKLVSANLEDGLAIISGGALASAPYDEVLGAYVI